jgi:hypothetical protein
VGAPAAPPAPSTPLPERPAAVAAALARTTGSLEAAIGAWQNASPHEPRRRAR